MSPELHHRPCPPRFLLSAVIFSLGMVLTVLIVNTADDVAAWAVGGITVGSVLALWH